MSTAAPTSGIMDLPLQEKSPNVGPHAANGTAVPHANGTAGPAMDAIKPAPAPVSTTAAATPAVGTGAPAPGQTTQSPTQKSPVTSAPVSPVPNKAQEKEHKQVEKMIASEAKVDERRLSSAMKDANGARKTEEKAAKSEAKAKKALDKAIKTEYKTKKEFLKSQEKHQKAEIALKKAQQEMELKSNRHATQAQMKLEKQRTFDSVKHDKETADRERASRQASLT